MCSPFSCGTSNFPAEEYDIEELLSPCKSHTKTAKKIKSGRSKNPYADSGRDKFNALLAELESKKQKIYTQKGSEDISFIRFVYSSSGGDWKPIVVKAKVKIGSEEASPEHVVKHGKNHVMEEASPAEHVVKVSNNGGIMSKGSQVKSDIRSRSRTSRFFSLENLRQPSSYLSLMLILMLLLLSISGKTFAILFTTIGWYILPLPIKEKGVALKKKEYTRKLSERNVLKNGSASPNSVLDGPEGNSPAAKHAHRKSW